MPMESRTKLLAPHQLRMRFFDLEATIQSDAKAFVNRFAQMYHRFQATGSFSGERPSVAFTVLTGPDNPWHQPVLILDEQVTPLKSPVLLEGYVYEAILNVILSQVRSHFLIHAGVVSWHGEGVVLAADSSHGKTTLVLELVRRGFKFLSDEIAALGRADGRVHPFPRCLRIRPGALELAGFPAAEVAAPQWLDKLLLDIEDIRPGGMGESAPISHVVVLQDPLEEREERPAGPERELGILVDRLDEDLLNLAGQIEGVAEISTEIDRGYPLLKLRTENRTRVLSHLETICREQGILMLDVIKRREGHPSFNVPAKIEALPNSQATMELLRRFQGGHKSALLQEECDGSATRLFVELAEIITQARCHRLQVGPLNQMADLVCGLVS